MSLGQTGTGGGGGKGIKKVIVDLPEKFSLAFIEKIRTILIQNTSDNWLEKFGELKQFFEINGHSSPVIRHPSLGSWVSNQRREFKKDKLSQERIQLLESIGLIWDPIEEEWQTKYQELKEYAVVNSHASPESRHPSLGKWVSNTRRAFKKGILSKEKVELLESIGFVWDPLNQE